MKVEKKKIASLTKCYSIAPLHYNNTDHFLVAAEKVDRCILFDLDGNEEDTVWSEPGGVMSMVQVPGSNGQFLATHKFYSPNDGADASIVIVTPLGKGNWERRTLVKLPFVHRFDIVSRNGKNYLIACTIKTASEYKDDWRSPGKTYAAELPADLSAFNESNQLKLSVIKDNMLKNHGYYKVSDDDGQDCCIISCAEGVFKFVPSAHGTDWEIALLTDMGASDAVLLDLDEDGEKELAVLSPFHGDTFSILKKVNGVFKTVYEYPEKIEFLHAIYGGMVCGKPQMIVGYRKGKRELLAISYDKTKSGYTAQILDSDCGPANVMHYVKDDTDIVISTNREIDEVAMYRLTVE